MQHQTPQFEALEVFEALKDTGLAETDVSLAAVPSTGSEVGFDVIDQGTAFSVSSPDVPTVPFVFNSPHSGCHYTPHFLEQSRLSPLLLRKSEDALVDQLYNFVPDLGAPLLAANFPRAYVDVNREPFELDPLVIKGPVPANANHKSVRVAAGLGTIARVVGHGLEIYRQPLSLDEALWRIDQFYMPYHRKLRSLIEQQLANFETAILIDCHSMPSRQKSLNGSPVADIIIGDRFGTSANEELVVHLMDLLSGCGLQVELNAPYAGGYITEHYGQPDNGIHAIQVEINRSIYMDEVTLVPHSGFNELSEQLSSVFHSFTQDVLTTLVSVPVAAE